ncbi:S49 family peptidase [Halorientalis salina]|uniref:S49 family peptidase n=1 Tax=Halorientalis salina TaxID=2932266 RepID=UPI0010ACA082|nr:S49 family peptidase [Halorientalis salina]
MKPESRGLLDRLGGPVIVFGVVGLVVGAALVPYAWNTTRGPDGTVAVIEVHGTINGDTATAAIDAMREARQNESIEAVVLDVNSRGGTASASEQLYLAVKETKQEMPVVASVTGLAASGGYYTSAPADAIYVAPANAIGSIGVRATVPPQDTPDNQITSGPDKYSTATESEARQRVETLRRAFVGAVYEERSDELELSREELSHGKVYSGSEGVELGLADEVGGIDAAIDDAAGRAGLSDYETTRVESPSPSTLSQIGLNASESDGPTVESVRYFMIHGQLNVGGSADRTEVTRNGTN